MNKRIILFHLKEALEELQLTVQSMEREPECDAADFQVAMGHLYHHLNTAWNGRACTDEEFKKCSDEHFYKWRKFPRNAELNL